MTPGGGKCIARRGRKTETTPPSVFSSPSFSLSVLGEEGLWFQRKVDRFPISSPPRLDWKTLSKTGPTSKQPVSEAAISDNSTAKLLQCPPA